MTERSSAIRVVRAGIVGCGQVAEYHARYIQAQPGAELVAIADVDEGRARSFAARHGVDSVFTSLEEMLAVARLDVLHVVTPPHLHVRQALAAVKAGVHVLVEKPVALKQADAEALFRAASQNGVLVCPDFIHLFHPRLMEARELIESGRLGRVVHCEVFLGLDLEVELSEVRESLNPHWSFGLPGGVLHNYLTHAIYLASLWIDEVKDIHASPRVFGSQPQALTDHLDILLTGDGATAHVTLSLVTRPCPYFVKVYCERGVVQVDIDRLTLVVEAPSALPRIVSRVLGPLSQGWQLATCVAGNIVNRFRGRLIPYQGLRTLIGLFYESIRQGGPSPIAAQLALTVSRVEDAVLSQAGKTLVDVTPRPSRQPGIRRADRVLVTGASGHLGREVVRALVARGYAVRVLVRPLSHIDEFEDAGVEICFGDLRSIEVVRAAVTEVDTVVHLGAALRGSAEFMRDTANRGTANLAESAEAAGVRQLVYMSSLTVYDFLSLRDGDVIGPGARLEPVPQERGGYSVAKCEAEQIAIDYLRRGKVAWTILRPSVFFGNGYDPKGLLGFACGRWLVCPGRPGRRVLMTHVSDVAAAVLLAIGNSSAGGKVYTLSHPDTVCLRDYFRASIRGGTPRRARVIYIPYVAALGAMVAVKVLARLLGRSVGVNRRRLASLYRDIQVDSSLITQELGWIPGKDLLTQLQAETRN